MKTEKAIILRQVKYGEADLILHALNRQGCRIHLIAKGASRSRRRFMGGALEPFNYVQLTYRERSNRPRENEETIYFLEEAQLIKGFEGVRSDYDRLEVGIYFLQMVSQVCKEAALDNQELFDLLGNALQTLEHSKKLKCLKLLFELKLLHQQGILDLNTRSARIIGVHLSQHESLQLSEEEFLSFHQEIHQILNHYFHYQS